MASEVPQVAGVARDSGSELGTLARLTKYRTFKGNCASPSPTTLAAHHGSVSRMSYDCHLALLLLDPSVPHRTVERRQGKGTGLLPVADRQRRTRQSRLLNRGILGLREYRAHVWSLASASIHECHDC
jgi:hypothetical protein